MRCSMQVMPERCWQRAVTEHTVVRTVHGESIAHKVVTKDIAPDDIRESYTRTLIRYLLQQAQRLIL